MNTRDKIVAAALETFHAKGFADCSVQDIVDAAGVPKGSFYNYFKSKELLAIEIVDIYLQYLLSIMTEAKGATPIGRLKGFVEHAAQFHISSEFKKGCLMCNLSTETTDSYPKLRLALVQAFETWNEAVVDILEDAKEAGEVNSRHDLKQLARFFVNSWEGVTTRLKVDRSQRSIDDFSSIFFGSIL